MQVSVCRGNGSDQLRSHKRLPLCTLAGSASLALTFRLRDPSRHAVRLQIAALLVKRASRLSGAGARAAGPPPLPLRRAALHSWASGAAADLQRSPGPGPGLTRPAGCTRATIVFGPGPLVAAGPGREADSTRADSSTGEIPRQSESIQ